MFIKTIKLDDVFKVRSEFDIDKYVVRKNLELEYEDAINSDLCILVRGNSGVGKTWLTYRMMMQTESRYRIINLASIKELGCLITLMDDYAVKGYGTKFIIIGTNTDIQRFFSAPPNADTIDNRIRELPEVKGFSEPECYTFVINGFEKLGIKIPLSQQVDINKQIYKLTCGIPQRLHELCRIIAQIHLNNNIYDFATDYIKEAQKKWLITSFSKNYALFSEIYRSNCRDNENNNYILFIIAEQDSLQFDYLKIQAILSQFFPNKNIGKNVVKNYLKKLADTSKNNNILVPHDNDYYSVRDYKTILCLRSMLYLDEDDVKMYDIQEL